MKRWWRRLMSGYVEVRPHTNRLDCWCRWVVGADCTPFDLTAAHNRGAAG